MFCKKLFDYNNYKIKISFLEIQFFNRNYCNVETDYGYKKMIITKLELKYDGGLSGYIEGVGD